MSVETSHTIRESIRRARAHPRWEQIKTIYAVIVLALIPLIIPLE